MKMKSYLGVLLAAPFILSAAPAAIAGDDGHGDGNRSACKNLPNYSALKTALDAAVLTEESGLNLNMWATIVNRDGVVCAVAFSGVDRGAQWPASRAISAQKANTANSLSLDSTSVSVGGGAALALSSANLYAAVQPDGSLFGLQESNPVETAVAYQGNPVYYGKANDPMVGGKIGGINVFGGGLALYAEGQKIVGGVGVSGDTSCADHMIAWRVRNNLGLDHLLGGVGGVAALFNGDPNHPDNIIYDIAPISNTDPSYPANHVVGNLGVSISGFGHPQCLKTELDVTNNNILPPVIP